MYFTHGSLAGVSIFVQANSDTEHRNARFAAVGALTSSFDDHSLAWRHLEPLKQLAQTVIGDLDSHELLEAYWAKVDKETSTKSTSSGSQHLQHVDLHANHPARSIKRIFDLFGPLLFPLQRQAMLHRRILILGRPPVEDNCEIGKCGRAILARLTIAVYNLSLLTQRAPDGHRRPLYSVGIADMATLMETTSWTACTTDAILKEKTNLYDILVELRDDSAAPRISHTNGSEIRATQRDLQRFHALHRHLWVVDEETGPSNIYQDDPDDTDQSKLLDNVSKEYITTDVPWNSVEPYSWSRLTQKSISWWSSPDEHMDWDGDELEHEMLRGLPVPPDHTRGAAHAVIIPAYFEKTSKMIMDAAAQAADESSDNEINVPASVLTRAGLDIWSQNDHDFFSCVVEELSGRKTTVVDEPITLCGIRVC